MMEQGFHISPVLFAPSRLAALSALVDALSIDNPGARYLLALPFCRQLADEVHSHPAIAALVATDSVAIQCTYFEKSAGRNWLVPLHQDLSVPVQNRTDDARLRAWSNKADGMYVQPPVSLLEQLVAVRVHLDDCGENDGPLRIVPASFNKGRLDDAQVSALRAEHGERVCIVAAGAALVMKPLCLHASSKSTGSSRRRVLHFLFGPPEPGFGLAWRASGGAPFLTLLRW